MRLPFVSTVRPTRKLLTALGLAAAAGLILGAARIAAPESDSVESAAGLWVWLVAVFGLIAAWDAVRRISPNEYRVERHLPNSFSLNKPQTIQFDFENLSDRPLSVTLSDGVPAHFESTRFPLKQSVDAEKLGVFEYTVVPKRRGLASFDPAYLLVESRMGFWENLLRVGHNDASKVYPDFSAISNSFIFGVEQAMRNMGAHIAKRKGDGMEFNQLRDFREGDTPQTD